MTKTVKHAIPVVTGQVCGHDCFDRAAVTCRNEAAYIHGRCALRHGVCCAGQRTQIRELIEGDRE